LVNWVTEGMNAATLDMQEIGHTGSSEHDPKSSRRIKELQEAIQHQNHMGMTEYVLTVTLDRWRGVTDCWFISPQHDSRQRAKQLTASHIAALDKVRQDSYFLPSNMVVECSIKYIESQALSIAYQTETVQHLQSKSRDFQQFLVAILKEQERQGWDCDSLTFLSLIWNLNYAFWSRNIPKILSRQ
jgi:hypothetical protein